MDTVEGYPALFSLGCARSVVSFSSFLSLGPVFLLNALFTETYILFTRIYGEFGCGGILRGNYFHEELFPLFMGSLCRTR